MLVWRLSFFFFLFFFPLQGVDERGGLPVVLLEELDAASLREGDKMTLLRWSAAAASRCVAWRV